MNMIYRRRILMVLLCFLFFFLPCAVIYKSYSENQKRALYCLGSEGATQSLPAETCHDIEKVIMSSELRKFKPDELMKQVQDLQMCQWSGNASTLQSARSELKACCDAERNSLVTQENTHIGDKIIYETKKNKDILVTENLHEMFIKISPFANRSIGSCAVVGSGGILLNSCCGSEIDRADYVFRLNLPPMNYSYDIGTKTNLVTANPSILNTRYAKLNERRRHFMDLVKTFEPALILMQAFSYTGNTDLSFKAYYTLEDFASQQKVVFHHPNYLANLALYWKKKGLVARRLSSGFMIVNTALEICDKVTLYGFWPFSKDPNGKPIPHHYYDDKLPKPAHSMPDEFLLYSQMHSQGILKLKTGRCI